MENAINKLSAAAFRELCDTLADRVRSLRSCLIAELPREIERVGQAMGELRAAQLARRNQTAEALRARRLSEAETTIARARASYTETNDNRASAESLAAMAKIMRLSPAETAALPKVIRGASERSHFAESEVVKRCWASAEVRAHIARICGQVTP